MVYCQLKGACPLCIFMHYAFCIASVELNPIRDGIVDSLTTSDHTSIKRRCEQVEKAEQLNDTLQQAEGLDPFASNPGINMPNGLPFRLTNYLERVDWIGRILRDDKRNEIPETTPPILQQLNID
jgi:hypothetical protein